MRSRRVGDAFHGRRAQFGGRPATPAKRVLRPDTDPDAHDAPQPDTASLGDVPTFFVNLIQAKGAATARASDLSASCARPGLSRCEQPRSPHQRRTARSRAATDLFPMSNDILSDNGADIRRSPVHRQATEGLSTPFDFTAIEEAERRTASRPTDSIRAAMHAPSLTPAQIPGGTARNWPAPSPVS